MLSGPTSSEAGHVFPVDTCTQSMCIHHKCTYIHCWPYRSQTDTHSTHTNTDSTTSLILLPAPAEQDGGLEVGIYHISTRWSPPAAGLRQSVQQLPLDPSLPSCCHLDIQALEATAPLQLLVQTITNTHTHTQPELSRTPLFPIATPLCSHPYRHTAALIPRGGP